VKLLICLHILLLPELDARPLASRERSDALYRLSYRNC
jgi:hypothetical protein